MTFHEDCWKKTIALMMSVKSILKLNNEYFNLIKFNIFFFFLYLCFWEYRVWFMIFKYVFFLYFKESFLYLTTRGSRNSGVFLFFSFCMCLRYTKIFCQMRINNAWDYMCIEFFIIICFFFLIHGRAFAAQLQKENNFAIYIVCMCVRCIQG